MEGDQKIDGLFMTGLQSVNGIEPFFDCLFSFLRRKTDFFSSGKFYLLNDSRCL